MTAIQQQQIARYFDKPPILFIPGLGQAYGTNGGIILSQLIYWSGKGSRVDGWIYKTIEELEQETSLSRSQQDTAIAVLRQSGVVDVTLKGTPARRHFKVNFDKLRMHLNSLRKSSKLESINSGRKFVDNQQTNTKTTQKILTKKPRRRKTMSIGDIASTRLAALRDK